MKRRFKVIVERTEDGYVAYSIGLRGVVVSDGGTFEEALDNVKSAVAFHIQDSGERTLIPGYRSPATGSDLLYRCTSPACRIGGADRPACRIGGVDRCAMFRPGRRG